MKWKIVLAILLTGCIFSGQVSAEDTLRAEAMQSFSPIPSAPPVLKSNPLTPEKIELGKILFFYALSRI